MTHKTIIDEFYQKLSRKPETTEDRWLRAIDAFEFVVWCIHPTSPHYRRCARKIAAINLLDLRTNYLKKKGQIYINTDTIFEDCIFKSIYYEEFLKIPRKLKYVLNVPSITCFEKQLLTDSYHEVAADMVDLAISYSRAREKNWRAPSPEVFYNYLENSYKLRKAALKLRWKDKEHSAITLYLRKYQNLFFIDEFNLKDSRFWKALTRLENENIMRFFSAYKQVNMQLPSHKFGIISSSEDIPITESIVLPEIKVDTLEYFEQYGPRQGIR